MRQALGLGRVRGPDPVLRQGEPVGAAALPGARWRDADEVDPQSEVAHEPGPELAELLDRAWAVGERLADPTGGLDHRGLAAAAPASAGPIAAAPGGRRGAYAPVLAPRHDVDRHPHQRRLDDAAVLEGRRERVAREVAQSRPQPDVARWRVLRLEAADLLDRVGDRERRAFEEELARQQGAIQGAGLRVRTVTPR